MSNTELAIIRIKKGALEKVSLDESRLRGLGYKDITFEIPQVQVISRIQKGENIFIYKPLLLNYGFVRLPIEYVKNPLILRDLIRDSLVIESFFYRKRKAVEDEVKLAKEEEGLDIFPNLVEVISEEELTLLYAEASRVEVKKDSSEIEEGDYIILMKYPFEGLGCKVLKKADNGKVQVEILSTSLTVWLDQESVIYNQLEDDSLYETN